MVYEIREQHSLSDELLRIWTEEIEFSIQQLQKQRQIDLGIQQARESISKVQSLLRLVRKSLGEKKFTKSSIAYRDAAYSISGIDDIVAMQQILAKLKNRYRRQTLHAGIEAVIPDLEKWKQEAVSTIRQGEDLRLEAIALLEKSLKKRKTWKNTDDEFSWILPNLEQTYQEGRDAFRKAKKKSKSPMLQAWRQEVGCLHHQLQLLHNCWPEMVAPWSEEFHRLSTLLDDEQALLRLRDHVRQERLIPGRVRGKADLLAAIKEYRKELRQTYFPLGEKLFHQKAKDFPTSLATYWEIWRNQ